MKKLGKRYKIVRTIEEILTVLLMILFLAVLILASMFPYNEATRMLAWIVIGMAIIHLLLEGLENRLLKHFFIEGCQSGTNVYIYEKVRLLTGNEELLPSMIGIFFEKLNDSSYFIYTVYKTKNTRETPYHIKDIRGSNQYRYELTDRIEVTNLKDIGSYINIV